MATTYKFRQVGVETLTARVFADGVDIHPTHELRACTRYQWFKDELVGDGGVAISGATNDTYDVDLDIVASSGEYYCEVTIGNTGDCDQTTQRRRITIVECLDTTDRTLGPTGSSGEFRVVAPHYETPIFSAEGNDWINPDGLITCDTQTAHVCRFVQNFTLDDQTAASNAARRGQPTITVGELTCFYNIVQGYVAAPPAPEPVPDQPAGPFINLSTDGPTLALVVFGSGTPITVTAEVGTIGGTGNETYTIAWTGAVVDPNDDRIATVANPGAPAQSIPVTATVTSSTGGTATASINAEFIIFSFPDQSFVMGDLAGQVNWRVLRSLGPNGSPPGTRTQSGTFTTSGAGNWNASLNWYEGFLGQPSTSGQAVVTITGPGVNETLTVNPSSVTAMFEATNLVGSYNWTISITGVQPDTSYANSSLLINTRLF